MCFLLMLLYKGPSKSSDPSFVCHFGSLFDEIPKLSMMVTPTLLMTKLLIACFQLIYKILYYDKFDVSYSIWLTQWKYSGLFFEKHGVWLWLWEEDW